MACCTPAPDTAPRGSRRRRLWDLDHSSHCPLVGVALPLATLRRLTCKALPHCTDLSDYEVHATAVHACGQRSPLAELLQAELDTRYARDIQRFRAAKSTAAVAELWLAALREGDVPAAFWAALTHPQCDTDVQDAMGKDLHMFQHQAGAGVRLEMARFQALVEENGVLGRELGRVQERITRVVAERSSTIEHLQSQLLQARAAVLAKDSHIVFLQQDMHALQAMVPQLQEVQRLQQRLHRQTQHTQTLQAQNAALRRDLAQAQRTASAAPASCNPVRCPQAQATPPQAAPMDLQHKVVLCVGGRTGNVASYRNVVEGVGARFAHHDGGLEDNVGVLDANLAAADLVICQTGCISHNAYWRVKDFCKRTGKRCLFVENASASSLERGLAEVALPTGDAP